MLKRLGVSLEQRRGRSFCKPPVAGLLFNRNMITSLAGCIIRRVRMSETHDRLEVPSGDGE